jgi:hypothetical protein
VRGYLIGALLACGCAVRAPDSLAGRAQPPSEPCRGVGDCRRPHEVCIAPDYEQPSGIEIEPPDCSKVGCPANQRCRHGRCELLHCRRDDECSRNYRCVEQICQRATCVADSECEGACVNSTCYPVPGTCGQPPPCCPP